MTEIEKLRAQMTAIREGLTNILKQLDEIDKAWQETGRPATAIEDIRSRFPEALRQKLVFSMEADKIIIRPKKYLGSKDFAETAQIVRDAGGEYISAGKESHFRVPFKEEKK